MGSKKRINPRENKLTKHKEHEELMEKKHKIQK